ncbi:MAG: hypothetical protein MI808_22005 [Pseudomonadales bacterium]|nr:hypothetical protein [Pseudomonadales bacterium]
MNTTRHELAHAIALALGLHQLQLEYPKAKNPAFYLKNWEAMMTRTSFMPLRSDVDETHKDALTPPPRAIVGAVACAGAFIELSPDEAKRFLWQPDYSQLKALGMSSEDFHFGRIDTQADPSDSEKTVLMATHLLSQRPEFHKAANRLNRLLGIQESIWLSMNEISSAKSRGHALQHARALVMEAKRKGGLAA